MVEWSVETQIGYKLRTSVFSAAYIVQDLIALLLWIPFNTASYASNYKFVLARHNAHGVTVSFLCLPGSENNEKALSGTCSLYVA